MDIARRELGNSSSSLMESVAAWAADAGSDAASTDRAAAAKL